MTGSRRTERWTARARVAARGLAARMRQIVTTEPGAGPDAGAEARARAGADEARRLRGGVAKQAQLVGYLDAFGLEADTRASLARLWDAIEPVGADAIAAVVEAELGAAPAALFARWEESPLAAASLGQVHGAADADGAEYAVKVQYPGVADALRDDVAAAGLVRALAGTALGAHLPDDAVAALRAALLREVDYDAEADAMERTAAAFAGDERALIPAVDRRRSSGRVLTMERVRGLTLLEAAEAVEPVRAAAAAAILHFAWAGPLAHGLVHGDPNPGNYLVLPGPPVRVAFLDHGCSARLDPATRDAERATWRALLDRDPFAAAERFRQGLHGLGMIPSARAFGEPTYQAWEHLVTAPIRAAGAFHFSPAYAADLVAATRRAVGTELVRTPGPVVLLWRQRLGVAAVLGLLDVAIDARAIIGCALGAAPAPRSTDVPSLGHTH